MGRWCWPLHKQTMHRSRPLSLILVFVLALLFACAPPAPQPTGTLQGHVTIGPLVPVQRVDEPDPTPAPEVYAAYPIIIYSADGSAEIAILVIDSQGNYQIELPVGDYLIDRERLGPSSAAGLPASITITAGETTVLDIDIDTGIR